MLDEAGVLFDDYKAALKVSERGVMVVLKREVKDRYINNYNPTLLQAWNANMDIQFCCDAYAVLTYITDYYGKGETDVAKKLSESAKVTKGMSQEEINRELKEVYLSSREVSMCEACYRVFPHLHLKSSNLTSVVILTGLPWRRSTFLKRLEEESDTVQLSQPEDAGGDMEVIGDLPGVELDPSERVELTGRPGHYSRTLHLQDHYAGPPRKRGRINVRSICYGLSNGLFTKVQEIG